MVELGIESRFSAPDFAELRRVGECSNIGTGCSCRDKLGGAWDMVLSSLKRTKLSL